ncbi:MAG: hypothetical protein NT019_03230 [Candidatus Adlerbacteria bacterium]|nr:hypothetical protein [Candidatus Adlerbacteria bacterium]
MQDMTPPNERSIRNVSVSAGHHRRTAPPPPDERFEEDIPLPKRHKSKRSRTLLWWGLAVVTICVLAGLLLSTFFQGASVVIYPKTQVINPPASFLALPNAPAGTLGYQTVSFSQTATTTAVASGTQHVSKQASGVVTIYNAYSTADQALVTNTRFQAPDGKIYKIHSPIKVPGATKVAGGALTPGSVTTTVYADVAGPEYNRTDATTFTIPGFKGDPRYTKFSAQSNGAISGGFVGEQPAVSAADMQKAGDLLKQQLDTSLTGALAAAVPSGFEGVQNSLTTTFSEITAVAGEGRNVSLSQTANVVAVMVSRSDLATTLAKLLVEGYAGEAVQFDPEKTITLAVASSSPKTNTGALTVVLEGSPVLVWQFDQNALIQTLLGKNKKDFEGIVETFAPAIVKAEASIRPFWKSTFPTDEKELSVSIKK